MSVRAIKRSWRCHAHPIPGSKRFFRTGNARVAVLGGLRLPGPSLDLDFINATALDPRITFTRAAGPATYLDATGTLQTAGTNVARFDHDPATFARRGLLLEEGRTNSLRNSTMVGAAAGSPGTAPTNWTPSTGSGPAWSIVGTGVEAGISYVDIRVLGTSSGADAFNLFCDTPTGIAATTGQVWTWSSYVRLVGGSFANTPSAAMALLELTAAGGFVASDSPTNFSLPTSAGLATQRKPSTITLAGGGTVGIVRPYIAFAYNAGAIDFTLRVGAPQLELGATVSSFIPTSTVAAVRAVEFASLPTAGWFNALAGTLVAEWITSIAPIAGTQGGIVRLDDGTDNNRILLFLNAPSGNVSFSSRSATVNQLVVNFGNSGLAAVMRAGATYNGTTWQAAPAGAAVSVAAGVAPVGINRLVLGATSGASSWYLNGCLRRIRNWPRAMLAPELRGVLR